MSMITSFLSRGLSRSANMGALAAVQQRCMSAVAATAPKKLETMQNFNALAPNSLGAVRHGGVSVLGCGLAIVALGGCAQGMGQLFAALVVGMARNPSMKDDLFTMTMVGIGFVELLAIVCILFAVMLLYSE